jgi:glycosyltransferase involved in cell wall biosynthesis
MSVAFAAALKSAARKHGFKVVVDVMDLPAHQFADLGFSLEMSVKNFLRFDRFVFGKADYLMVCSQSMTELIHKRYGVDESSLIVALNGHSIGEDGVEEGCFGTPLSRNPGDKRLKFAYAGTLNAARGIAPVLDAFLESDVDAEMHLCGPHGDWITTDYNDPRLIYHGALSDDQAAAALAGCDVGLIPYPEKGYYNLAYATKLSFYLGLGMAVLCSEARETASQVKRLGVGLCWPLADFASAFRQIAENADELSLWRKRANEVRADYSWTSIYTRAFDELERRAGALSYK